MPSALWRQQHCSHGGAKHGDGSIMSFVVVISLFAFYCSVLCISFSFLHVSVVSAGRAASGHR